MKPVYGVAFVPNVPVQLATFGAVEVPFASGPMMVMNCVEVHETSYGFLQLVPKTEPGHPLPTLFVPPHYIAWMIRADDPSGIGFLTKAGK